MNTSTRLSDIKSLNWVLLVLGCEYCHKIVEKYYYLPNVFSDRTFANWDDVVGRETTWKTSPKT